MFAFVHCSVRSHQNHAGECQVSSIWEGRKSSNLDLSIRFCTMYGFRQGEKHEEISNGRGVFPTKARLRVTFHSRNALGPGFETHCETHGRDHSEGARRGPWFANRCPDLLERQWACRGARSHWASTLALEWSQRGLPIDPKAIHWPWLTHGKHSRKGSTFTSSKKERGVVFQSNLLGPSFNKSKPIPNKALLGAGRCPGGSSPQRLTLEALCLQEGSCFVVGGGGFHLGVWGCGCVRQKLRLRLQPFTTVGNRRQRRRKALHNGERTWNGPESVSSWFASL